MRRLITGILLLAALTSFGQHRNYNIYNVSSEHGLPSNDLTHVFQDSFGFLWIGSYEGIFRWDGYAFKKYRHNEKDSSSLDHNIVYAVFEDSQRRLWVGTIDGLNLYDRLTDTFVKCQIGQIGEKIPVNAIREDSKGKLWLGTSSGLCKYEHGKGSEWFRDENFDTIFCLTIDLEDNIWAGTFNGGIKKFSQSTQSFRRFNEVTGRNALSSNNIKSIFADNQNHIWVGTMDQGVKVLDTEGNVLRTYQHLSENPGAIENTVNCIYQDKNGRILIGVGREPLYYIEESTGNLRKLSESVLNASPHSFVSVTSITEDTFGNTWFATTGSGLFYTNVNKNVFGNYLQNLDFFRDLKSTVITSFLEDKKGNIWIGTESSGFLRANMREGTFKAFSSRTHGLSNDAVTDLREDSDGKLWISTWNGGIMQFDPITESIRTFVHNPDDPNSIPLNDAKVLLPDDSVIWVGTHGAGLAAYHKKHGRFIHHRNNDVFPFQMNVPGWINHLFKDSFGRLWISTYSGLFVYDGKQLAHHVHSAEPSSISSNSVNMVTEDRFGRMWVATEGGLDEFDTRTQKFIRYRDMLDLPESVKSVIMDDNDKLWISTNEGLASVDVVSRRVKLFDASDGLQGNTFFHKAVLRDRKGRLYFGGPKGFNVFHPSELREFRLPKYFYTSELYIYNEVQQPGRDNSPLEVVLPFTEKLVLRPDQSFFTIEISTVNLYSPSKTRYAYRLEGLNDTWIPLQHERKIAFTELPPGEYTLKVRYTEVDGSWIPAGKELKLEILPPWWKTFWFKGVLMLLLSGSTALAFFLRVKSIQARNRFLKSEVDKRTYELSEANAFLIERAEMIKLQNERLEEYNQEILRQSEKILNQQKHITEQNQQLESTVDELQKLNRTKDQLFSILAHDLKNPISALTGISDFMKSNFLKLNKKDAMQYLDSIHKSSNAIYDLLINLLNWSRTQSRNIEYTPVPVAIREVFQKNLILLEPQLNNKHISFEIDEPAELTVFADYNMLDAVVRNILSNSVKFTEYNGSIKVAASMQGDSVEVRIADNGVGMTPEQLQRLFSLDKSNISSGTAGEKGTGLGLVITREFIQINKGTIRVESSVGNGTEFFITLPTGQSLSKSVLKVEQVDPPSGAAPDFWEAFPVDKLIKIRGKKVLIVDDNAELRSYLKMLLSGTFEIFEAGNGKEGLERALEIQPTAIVTDLIMPVMNGLEFCRQIKEHTATSHIPVMLLTSQWEEQSQLSGYEAGADIYLTKPVKKELFIQVILNFIQNQERLRQKIQENILSSHEFQVDEPSLNKLDEEFLTRLVSFIEAHVSDASLDARIICEEFGMSRTVLYAKIKTLTGQSVNEFIKSIRLKRSLVLLLEGRLNISQIALEVGFNSHSYFDKCFTKQYGVGPKEYIQKKRNMRVV